MIRLMLMRLLGLRPLYEVRRVNKSLNKDLPGTKIYGGPRYKDAVAAFKAAKEKLAAGHQVKLQVLIVLKSSWKLQRDDSENRPVGADIDPIVLNKESLAMQDTIIHKGTVDPQPDYKVEHTCDYAGPMALNAEGRYESTCSVCGASQ